MSGTNFDRTQCRCEKIDNICDDYAKLMKRHLENTYIAKADSERGLFTIK